MKCQDLEKAGAVREQVTQVQDAGELVCHRAMEAKHLKWEAREAQLEAHTGSGWVEPQEKPSSTP